jgi:RNA polymerase sigma-70 factor (ECF subfamily)
LLDAELIKKAQSGDRKAIVQVLKHLETPLYRTAYYLMGNEQDALDATQEALMKIYRYLPSYKGEALLFTWAQRIVTNVCIDFFRKRKNVFLMEEELQREDGKAAKEVEWGAVISDLKQAIRRLPLKQQTAIILRYVQEYNYQEIAEVMGLPLNTVKSHLFRARKQLQKWLSEYQEGGDVTWQTRK